MLQQAHKPGLLHLYDAVKMLEHRCKSSEEVLNSQLRSIGSDEEWQDYYPNPQENPFEAVRRRLLDRVGELEPTTNQPENTEELTDNTIFAESGEEAKSVAN